MSDHVITTLIVSLTVLGVITLVGTVVILGIRESEGHPLLPWGKRMQVEHAKARTEILQEHLEQDGIEIKRLALEAHRTNILAQIEKGDTEQAIRLSLTKGRD